MNKKTIFLDRDGIINKVIYRENLPASPRSKDEWFFEDGIQEFVGTLKDNNFYIFVITNQPDIKRGLLDSEMNLNFKNLVSSYLNIDDYVFCPHDDDDACQCRKPKPGMMSLLEKNWDIDKDNSFILGDSEKDILAGQAFGITTLLLNKDYNTHVKADFKFSKLSAVLDYLL